MADIEVLYHNEVYCFLSFSSRGIAQEINEIFSFRPPNYQFSPAFKGKWWDGFIRLFNTRTSHFPVGLIYKLKEYAQDAEYSITVCEEYEFDDDVDENYGRELAKMAGIPFDLRDYQNDYVVLSLKQRRSLTLAPVNAGKSLIQYLLYYHYRNVMDYKTLIIVPRGNLVLQMRDDFIDYGCSRDEIHCIPNDKTKNTDKKLVISTWQSIVKQDPEWFEQFHVILGDEAHNFEAKSLVSIMEKAETCRHRHGFTGTISRESKTHKMVLEGHFGKLNQKVKQKELIDRGISASFKIKCLILNHKEKTKTIFKTLLKEVEEKGKKTGKPRAAAKFQVEKKLLRNLPSRNKFIKNLIASLKNQNSLLLFQEREHCDVLEEILSEIPDIKLRIIHGSIDVNERNRIRKEIENDKEKNYIILASFGVFSEGINLKRLDNIIFASAFKAENKIIQSIGRVLRTGNGSDDAVLYDITDVLKTKGGDNYTLGHFKKRIEIYGMENFKFTIYNIDL